MKFLIVSLFLTGAVFATATERHRRSLVGVFPFSETHGDHGDHDNHHDHGEDHGDHHGDHQASSYQASSYQAQTSFQLPQLNSNQAQVKAPAPVTADDSLSIGNIAAAGRRCVDKVVMVEETEYDDVIECNHSYSERCHTTYTTDFEPQQEEECEENFKKSCFIEYKKVASTEKVKFCHTPLVCGQGDGPTICKTVYESQCETKYHVHDVVDDVVDCKTVYDEKCEDVTKGYTTEKKCDKWPRQECTTEKKAVKKYSPETECKKVPAQLCGPSQCQPKPGPEQCQDKDETVVLDVPEETCNLEPQKICKHVTKLVPLLKPAEECVDIPKEVCSRSRTNPRKVQKPVVKKWCYVPTPESGLA